MRIFKDREGTIYIVAGKKEDAPRVCIVKDDGENAHDIFGEKLQRFYYHYAGVSNNVPYSSRTNCIIRERDGAYQYKLVKVKKIKSLGRENK